jgi:hypothetical protein
MLLRRRAVVPAFHFERGRRSDPEVMQKYADLPMSFADACLVRMSEVLPDPIVLTTDTDVRIYRRHSRQTVPAVMPE